MKIDGRVVSTVQLYDELGQAFFPPTHKECVLGDLADLDLGTTLAEMDLTSCIMVEFTGTLKIKSFNSTIYAFCIDLTRSDGEDFAFNKTHVLARDIPDLVDMVHFKGVGNGTDDVQLWLENDYLKCRIVPRTERFYDSYVSSISNVVGSGLIIR